MRTRLFYTLLGCLFTGNCFAQSGRVTPEFLFTLGRVGEEAVSPDGKTAVYTVTKYDVAANKGEKDIYAVGLEKGAKPIQLTTDKGNESAPQYRQDGKKIGYLANKDGKTQLWEMNPDGSGKAAITSLASDVNAFEYTPDGKHLLLVMDVKIDTTMAEKYGDTPKSNAKLISGLMYRHWNAWHGPSWSHPFIATYTDGKVGQPKDLMPGERQDFPRQPFAGMEDIAASPDGKSIVYSCLKEEGAARATSTNADLYLYDIGSGITKNITEGNLGYDEHPAFSPDGHYLAYSSMEQAANEAAKPRLMVLELKTSQKTDLTKDFEDGIAAAPAWGKDGRGLYAPVHVRGTEQIYYFVYPSAAVKANPKDIIVEPASGVKAYRFGGGVQLTSGRQNMGSVVVATKNTLLCNRTAMDAPADLYTVDVKTGFSQNVTHANADRLKTVQLPRVESRTVKTSDGKDMLVWLILPAGFDETKKYPTLLFCQGGPEVPVSQNFSYRWNFMSMASNGYVIVAPCRRGMPGFGRAWNDAIIGDWGGQPIRDYLSAIDDAATLPYVDKNRLGAVGGSYGGYSTFYLAGVHNKRFKAFISHCGIFNMEAMQGTTEEQFFALTENQGPFYKQPQSKNYTEYSPHTLVDKWDTPILIIHGGQDFRVPESQGMDAYTAAQLRGIPSKFLYFPDEGHWVLKPQNSLVWNREFFNWLDTYLK